MIFLFISNSGNEFEDNQFSRLILLFLVRKDISSKSFEADILPVFSAIINCEII